MTSDPMVTKAEGLGELLLGAVIISLIPPRMETANKAQMTTKATMRATPTDAGKRGTLKITADIARAAAFVPPAGAR